VYGESQCMLLGFCPPFEPWMCLVDSRPLMGFFFHRPPHKVTFWEHHDRWYFTTILQG
jgi:hypothetical protein